MKGDTRTAGTRACRLEQLVTQYQTELLHMCCLYLRDAALAEDAVQETFLKAYLALDRFRGDCSEKTWLTRIAVNTCRDMLRCAWLRHTDRSMTPEMLPAASVPFEEKDEALILAVMELPLRLREAVVLHYGQGLSVKEIAGMLSRTPSTISNRLKRAVQKLRAALERSGWHE